MEEDNCVDENTEDGNQMEVMERSTPGSEQVTESGTPSEYSEIWNEFKCVFCTQDPKHMTNPKLLPCLHTACESCISSEANAESSPSSTGIDLYYFDADARVVKKRRRKKNISHAKGMKTKGKTVSCPFCSQVINVDKAVDHLFLMEYAQSSESLPEESNSYLCTSCEEGNEGTAFCQDCEEWLCESCVNAHHRVRITKDHIVRPKEEMEGENAAIQSQKYLLCSVHPNERLKVYCESCDKLTCRDCQLLEHKNHSYKFISNACDEGKDKISKLLGDIKKKQSLMEEASSNLNKRHEEIVDRESQISQEIQVFGVKFITDINKRAKALLTDLNKVCSDKKNLINMKSDELKSVSERLKHCQKFAEAAMALGSETALAYSKETIMSQLKQILTHKCDVPSPNHVVDIQLSYETNFLTSYISNLGQILVDQQPLPGSTNASGMLPMPQPVPQSPVPNPPVQQTPLRQIVHLQNSQRTTIPPVQQINQHQQQVAYGQPQVTSSTDLVRNNPQMRQMVTNYRARAPVPNQQPNFHMQNNVVARFSSPRQQMVHQQSPQLQMRQRPQQVQAQTPQQQVQQIQQQVQQQMQKQQSQQQAQQQFNSSNQLPSHLRQNKSISVTTLPSPGPSPSKQRAIAPRNVGGNTQGNAIMQANNNQTAQGRPQVIVLDDNQKTPNMSNTNRLSHFPSSLAATLAANPSLQIQPATNNNFTSASENITNSSIGQSSAILNLLQKPTVLSYNVQSESPSLVLNQLSMNDASSFNQQMGDPDASAVVAPTTHPFGSDISLDCLLQGSPGGGKKSDIPTIQLSCSEAEAVNSPGYSSSDSLPSVESLLTLRSISLGETQKEDSSSSFQNSCQASDEKCVVCREGKNVVVCSKCLRAFHAECHIPNLVSPKLVVRNWICLLCRDVLTETIFSADTKRKLIDLQGRELLICERILLEVFTHPKSWYFHQRVSKKVPNYYKVIKKPMDLSTIRMKLAPTHFEHYKDVEEFCDDVRLVFENCFTFNSEGSDVHNAGKIIQEHFEKILSHYFPELTLAE